jgi:hypothetical protein
MVVQLRYVMADLEPAGLAVAEIHHPGSQFYEDR